MKGISVLISLGTMLALSRCIGTDLLAELEVDEHIIIAEQVDSLALNDSFTFQAVVIRADGTSHSPEIQWSSSASSVISIDPFSGNATALNNGTAFISARYRELQDSVQVSAGGMTSTSASRTGTFSGSNNYTVNGTFRLESGGGGLLLIFNDDFTTSNGPGLYVYLSASPDNASGGLEVGPLQSSRGAQQYQIDESISLARYDYVIIYCKPFGVPFGTGMLNEI